MAADIIGSLTSLLPSTSGLLTGLVATGATSIVLSGLKSDAGQDTVDPLHWFHHPASGATGVVQGNVMVASQFSKLDPATQTALLNAHYTVIPG